MSEDGSANEEVRTIAVRLTAAEAVSIAIRRQRQGLLPAAEEIYEAVLGAHPDDPDALHFLGVLRHQSGQGEAALGLIERALSLRPDYVDAYNNLGNVHHALGHLEQARAAYQRALELSPQHLGALNNLGVIQKTLGHSEEALEIYQRALAIDPDNRDVLLNLGNLYRLKKDFGTAIRLFRRALTLGPYRADAYKNLATTLYAMKDHEQAIETMREWLACDPDDPVARHLYAAYTGKHVPARASDRYVLDVFESFAGTYDEVLRSLEFAVPDLLAAALAEAAGPPAGDRTVLDAGCGTGLTGVVLRPYARRLAGVDLSREMLARARERGIYDELVEQELTAFLAARHDAFDLIACGDTLCYFGDLRAVVDAAGGALRPGSLFLFTVEKADGDDAAQGFRLNEHGRYSHSERYVAEVLGERGFRVERVATAPLRQEFEEDVAGLIVTARRLGA